MRNLKYFSASSRSIARLRASWASHPRLDER
jgi:hypothetical protein